MEREEEGRRKGRRGEEKEELRGGKKAERDSR